jgi:hypothetical protein
MKSYLNIVTSFFPEGKISRLNLVMGGSCLFSGTAEESFTRSV